MLSIDETLCCLATSAEGNLLVLAGNPLLATFDNDGALVWTKRLPSTSIVMLADSLIVASRGDDESQYAIEAFNLNGAYRWNSTVQLQGIAWFPDPILVFSKTSSELVLVVNVWNSESHADIFVVGVEPSTGELLWTALFDGGRLLDDVARSAAPGENGIYVTGSIVGRNGPDLTTLLFSNGKLIWRADYNGAADLSDGGESLVVDSLRQRVFVGGTSVGSGTQADLVVLAYSADGHPLWQKRFEGPMGDQGARLALRGNVLAVAGSTENANGFLDYLAIGYDVNTGSMIWTNSWNGILGGPDVVTNIAPLQDGFAVTGYSSGAVVDVDGNYDFATVAFDSLTGEVLWIAGYNGLGNGDDIPCCILSDLERERLYVAGTTSLGTLHVAAGELLQDYVLLAYDDRPELLDSIIS